MKKLPNIGTLVAWVVVAVLGYGFISGYIKSRQNTDFYFEDRFALICEELRPLQFINEDGERELDLETYLKTTCNEFYEKVEYSDDPYEAGDIGLF